MRLGNLSVAALVACSVIACSSKSEPSAKQSSPEATPVAGTSPFAEIEAKLAANNPVDQGKVIADTPDNAVKSWWGVFDLFRKQGADTCHVELNSRALWAKKNMSSLWSPEAIDRFLERSTGCEQETWRRQIDEVKSESDTRAVVYATVWTNEKAPEDARRDDIEAAKKGTKFKYVLEKSAGKWVISDVLRYDPATSYRNERWERVYEKSDSGLLFSGTVYSQ